MEELVKFSSRRTLRSVFAGRKGSFTAFVMDAEIPALLRMGALEAPGTQLDFAKDTLLLDRRGVCVPLGLNATAGGNWGGLCPSWPKCDAAFVSLLAITL